MEVEFNSVYVSPDARGVPSSASGISPPGRVSLKPGNSGGIVFSLKNPVPGAANNAPVKLFEASDVLKATWSEFGAQACLNVYLSRAKEAAEAAGEDDEEAAEDTPEQGNKSNKNEFIRIHGLSRNDEANCRQCVVSWGESVTFDSEPWAATGVNFGRMEVVKEKRATQITSYDDSNKTVLEIPLVGVSQVMVPAKNEVEIQYVSSLLDKSKSDFDDAQKFELVVARLYIPNNSDDAEVTDLVAGMMKDASALQDDAVEQELRCEIGADICNFLTPRGKFRIEFSKDYFRMRGKTYDFKIPYDTVSQLYLLKKPDSNEASFFVISLSIPQRQGQQRYPNLTMQIEKNASGRLTINMTQEEIEAEFPKSTMTPENNGDMATLVAKAFKMFCKTKVYVEGGFETSHKDTALRCNYKTISGYLYPLKSAFSFVHKPTLFIKYEHVSIVEFVLHAATGGVDSRAWDLSISTKPSSSEPSGATHVFQSIGKDELVPLLRFLDKESSVTIKDKASLLERANKNTLFGRGAAAGAGILDMDLGDDDDDDDDDDVSEPGDSSSSSDDSDDSDGSSDEGDDEAEGEEGDVKKEKKPKKEKKEKKEKKPRAAASEEKPKKLKKDPNAPKGPAPAYALFAASKRKVLQSEGVTSFADVSKRIAELWKAATPEEKAVFEAASVADRERYRAEMATYVPPEGFEASTKKGKKAPKKAGKAGKDPNAPKRAATAYLLFQVEERKSPEYSSLAFGDVAKKISEKWKSMSAEEKEVYEAKARVDRERYLAEKASYVPPEGAEFKPAGKRRSEDDGQPSAKRRKREASAAAGAPDDSSSEDYPEDYQAAMEEDDGDESDAEAAVSQDQPDVKVEDVKVEDAEAA